MWFGSSPAGVFGPVDPHLHSAICNPAGGAGQQSDTIIRTKMPTPTLSNARYHDASLGRRGLLAVCVYGAIFLALLAFALATPRGEFVLVVGKPGQSEGQVIELIGRAGGSFVAPGRFGWIAVAHSSAPDFVRKLNAAGAFLVLNHALAVGCLQKDT